jgi:adenylate cyclase
MDELSTYLPQDRRVALARGESLPERTSGSALFADISGFTPLTERMIGTLGERRGTEELIVHINTVYEALIGKVDEFGGSVIGFAGDAITCWFDENGHTPPVRAILCAQGMQAVMARFPDLSLKVSVSTGKAGRFAAGDPEIRLIDTLTGSAVARLAAADHLARPGEIIMDEATSAALGFLDCEARSSETHERYYALNSARGVSRQLIASSGAGSDLEQAALDPDLIRSWILPELYEHRGARERLNLAELRPVTALFVRFTGIDYESDEHARTKLVAVVSKMQRIVEHHGGLLLDLTIGDKGSYVMISFGALHAHEDDSRRAVRAALEIKEGLAASEFLEASQCGVSSGTMLVGAYGAANRRAFGVMGDDVNLAARLMMVAARGEILVSQRVRKALADEFTVEARPPMTVKGKAEPLPVFAVLGAQQHRPLRLQEPSYALPMIGRAHELSLLEEKLALTLRGQGQVIGITAEAGMGKSRLVAEAIRLSRQRNIVGYGGTCSSEGSNIPYLVWQDIWRAFFDIDTSASQRKQIRAIEGELQDLAPEWVAALPLVGTLLGLAIPDNDFTRSLQPKDRRVQLETALVNCLRSAAREAAEDGGGLLFVLEDLHWIDPVSLDLLELIARAIDTLPVAILITYRPPDSEQAARAIARFQALDHFTELRLTELGPEEMEQAIRAKLSQLFPERSGGVPAHLIDRVSSRAQGNPFYVEELLNYLHDRGVDPHDTEALDALALPASLYGLILSRIDQLTASQQLSLKAASIIGRVFRFIDLCSYYPALGTAEHVRMDLQELERLDLTPLESAEPELTYLFKHLVTHEVAYESLAFHTRARLHAEYARYLESAFSDRAEQLASQLAHHFEKAGDPEKARVYLLKAAHQAAAGYANQEALAYFDRALGLTPESQRRERFEILWQRERTLDLLGRRSEQRRDLASLRTLTDHLEDAPFLHGQIAARQAQLEIDVGEYAAATDSAEACIREMEPHAPSDARAQELLIDAHLLRARTKFLSGETAAARDELRESLSLAHQYRYVRGEYNALAQLGTWNWSTGDYEAATRFMEQALQLTQQAGDTRRELDILNNLGIVAKARGRYAEAIACYEQAQQIAHKIGDRSGEATLLNNMGSASLAYGDFVRAGDYAGQAAAMAAELNEATLQGIALTNRGEAHRELGEYGLALAAASQALMLVRASGYRRGEAIVLDNIGLIHLSLGNHAEAREAAEAALAIAREIGSRATEAYVQAHLGRVLTQMGEFEPAQQHVLVAKDIAASLNDPSQLLEVQAVLAELGLAREGAGGMGSALLHLEDLIGEITAEPATDQSHILPLWMYLTCVRAAQAAHDPRAAHLLARAQSELRARSERISEPSLRAEYLRVPEHRVIMMLGASPKASLP